MPTAFKLTSVFQLTTVPNDEAVAAAHTGGWTENIWSNTGEPAAFLVQWGQLQSARANLLPASARIIGYRYTSYTYTGNFLTPGVSRAGRQNFPGVIGNVTDLPQVALHLAAKATAGNGSNVTLRGVPDTFMQGGEYAPTPAFRALINAFINKLTAGNFGFLGRDKTQASVRVLFATAESITLSALPATGLAVGDFVRLNRVFASDNLAITGSFRVLTISPTTPTITVVGWPAGKLVQKPSGTLRRDQIAYLPYSSAQVVRAVVKKVGSPLEKYRGRASKRRV